MVRLLISNEIAKSNIEENKTITFYISTNGSDKNDGSINHPFASLERAAVAIEELTKRGEGRLLNNVEVLFREGIYRISQGTSFKGINPVEGASVTIGSYQKENVILSGGRKINGKNFRDCKDRVNIGEASL